MPRIRTIKPELKSDPKLAKVSRDARWVFVCCISEADDEGFLWASLRQLLATFYPHDSDLKEDDLRGWLDELVNVNVLRWRHSRHGPLALEVVNFGRHQVINRSTPSRIRPDLLDASDHATLTEASLSPHRSFTEPSSLEGNGREWNGSLGTSRDAPAQEPGINSAPRPPYETDFEELWDARPRRLGPDNKKAAHKAWKSLRRAGVDHTEIIDGVKRYAAHIQATGKNGTQYVKQLSTFLGPNAHFRDSYPAAEPSTNGHPTSGDDARIASINQWRNDEEHRMLSEDQGKRSAMETVS